MLRKSRKTATKRPPYENCKSDIPLFYLVRIADTLETSLDYLAGRTEAQEYSTLEQRLKRLEDIVLK